MVCVLPACAYPRVHVTCVCNYLCIPLFSRSSLILVRMYLRVCLDAHASVWREKERVYTPYLEQAFLPSDLAFEEACPMVLRLVGVVNTIPQSSPTVALPQKPQSNS